SSRRRHTRSKRDWSSDVCSSDLMAATIRRIESPRRVLCHAVGAGVKFVERSSLTVGTRAKALLDKPAVAPGREPGTERPRGEERSEERRVGNGGRAGGAREASRD